MTTFAWVLAVAVALPAPSALKCTDLVDLPGVRTDRPVLLLDGRIMDSTDTPWTRLEEMITPEEVESVQVTCWNPERDAFGGGPGVPVIRIHSTRLVDAVRAPLDALVRAQAAHREATGGHARTLAALGSHGLPADPGVILDADARGWSARTPGEEVAMQCTATWSVGAGAEARVACAPVDARELRVLRERFGPLLGEAAGGV